MKIIKKSIFIATAFSFIGMVGAPLAASAAAGTTVSSTISPVISLLSSSGTVNLNAIPTSGGVQTIASDTVTVSTNNSAGYTLKLGETTGSSAMTSGGNTIVASTASQLTPLAQTVNSWGYRVDGIGGFGAGPTSGVSSQTIGTAKFAAIPATGSPDTLATTNTTASGVATTVWYAVAVNTAVPSGTYTNSVTYTAIAN